MEKEQISPPRKRWHRLLSVLMTLTLIVATIAWPQSAETVKAADSLEMKVNSDGDITWTTSTQINDSTGIRFHTIGWYFRFQYYNSTKGEWVQYPKSPVLAKMDSGTIYANNKKVGTYDGSVGSSTMKYTLSGLEEYYSGDDQKYRIYADAYVEFYDYDHHKSLKKVSNREDAEAAARSYGMTGGPYFKNYYNRSVKIPNVKLKAKCDSGLVSPTINGTKGQSNSDNAAVKWVKTGSTPDLQVEARRNGGYKGYACVSANKAGSTKLIDGLQSLPDQGGRIDGYTVDKNTTIEFNSKPLQVKVTFHVDGNKIGSQTFTYNKGGTFGDTVELDSFSGLNLDTSGAEWSTTEDDSVGSKHYDLFQGVDNSIIMELYEANGGFDPSDVNTTKGTVKAHTIDLYAISEDPIPPANSLDYQIVYNGNGSTSGKMNPTPAEYNTSVMLSHIKYTKDGYHTTKTNTWKSKKSSVYYDDCEKVNSTSIDFDDSTKKKVTLYANWQPNKCSINYDGNGSTSGAVSKQTITFDKWTQTIAENTYRKNGKAPSVSWNTQPDGKGTSIKAGTKIDKTLWKKLFGSVNKNGRTITLYAIWDGSGGNQSTAEDPEVVPIGNGNLTYKSGNIGNDSYGPETYDINGSVTVKNCMFGDYYTEDTPKVYKYSNGVKVDGHYLNQECDYLIRGGSTVLEEFDKYYTFKGWSVDQNAIWSQSQPVINYPNTIVGGKDLAFTYFGYLNPAIENPAWGSGSIDRPLVTFNPSNASSRALTIRNSRDAWLKYEAVLNSEITKQTNIRDEEKAIVEDLKLQIESVKLKINSLVYPTAPYMPIPELPSNPTKEEQQAYDSAMEDYHSVMRNHQNAVDEYNRTLARYDQERKGLENEKAYHEDLMNEAQEKLDAACAALNQLNADISRTITLPNGTFLYAVWDQFPEFVNMSDIVISMTGDYDYITDEWLLQHVTVVDREDGTLTNGVDVVVENFDPIEITKLEHTGGTTVTFRATDSAGNVTRYTIFIFVEGLKELEQTTLTDLSGKLYFEDSYPRFICREAFEIGDPQSPNYYGNGYNGTTTNMYGQKVPVYLYLGGLHPESIWYTDPEYRAAIYKGFENEENDTPEEVWEFSHQDILDIQQFIDDHGLGDMKQEGTLDLFFETFKKCRTQCNVDYD